MVQITLGNVRCNGTDYEITGGALDALQLAEVFVQVFTVDMHASSLRNFAHKVECDGLLKEAAAVAIAVDLWESAESAYKRASMGGNVSDCCGQWRTISGYCRKCGGYRKAADHVAVAKL